VALNSSDLKSRLESDTVAYWQLLGIEIHEVYSVGDVSLVVDMREQLATRLPDIMHGGAISSLIDSAAGAAVSTIRAEDDSTWQGQATLDLNVTFLRAAKGRAIARAKVLKSSRSLVFISVDVKDESDELLATGRATYTIIRSR
tara:strand:+ start:12025 stop:12456 length:432 start_codon:yes stop_codon:yes gene_type:complete